MQDQDKRASRKRSRFYAVVREYLVTAKRDVASAALCVIGATIAALATPWPLKLIFDHVLLDKPLPEAFAFLGGWLHGGSLEALLVLSVAIVALAVLGGVCAFYQQFLTSRIGFGLVYTLRSELFNHLQRLSLSFHTRARSGELLTKITGDTNTLKNVYTESALTFSTHVLTIVGMFVVMFMLNVTLSLIVVASFPVLFVAVYLVFRNVSVSARKQRRNESKLASRVSEMLSAAPLVQAYGREDYERERFDQESAQSMEEGIRTARMEAAATRAVELIGAFGTALVVLFGAFQVFGGGMTPGDLLVFVAYINGLYKPVRLMAKLSTKFSKAQVSVERISEILEIEPEIQDAPDAIDMPEIDGRISFEGVSFGYDPGKPVLRELSFSISAGQRVALVGGSGAGKSTIVNLLIRLYDPSKGRICIDGTDVRRYRRESLRREVAVVLQDSILLGTTIRENIAYGKPDATDEEIVAAAREARAHDFISALPDSYDTVLGERGCTLSGGQRQRLCLARALVKRPSILILDEATSAVDPDSEAAIREAVKRLHQGKTLLLIAHQFSAVQDCDRILVLSQGQVVEQGTHDELVERRGHYYELFRLHREAAPIT